MTKHSAGSKARIRVPNIDGSFVEHAMHAHLVLADISAKVQGEPCLTRYDIANMAAMSLLSWLCDVLK